MNLQFDSEKSNLGGINQFSFIFEDELVSEIPIIKNQAREIQITSEGFIVAKLVQESAKFIEDKKNVNLFEYKFTANVARDDYSKLQDCSLFDSNRIIALVTDNNNHVRILGQKNNACELIIKFDKGQNVSDLNHYLIEITWQSRERAAILSDAYIIPQFIQDEEGEQIAIESSTLDNKVSSMELTESITGGYSYIIMPDPAVLGSFLSRKYIPANFGGPGGGGTWGSITGTLSDQTDLKTALGLKADLVTGKVPASQLPSYVDDVIEGVLINSTTFQVGGETITPEAGVIYSSISGDYSGKSYRWSGSQYVITSSDLTLGETSTTAFRGDYGKTAYDHSGATHAPTDAEKNVQADWNQADSGADDFIKNKPTIPSGSRFETYTTTATAGGTTTLTVASNCMQFFTGTLNQTVVMPDVTTLSLGFGFKVANLSSGIITINSSGGNTIIALAAGCEITLTCIAITGTGVASWKAFVEAIAVPASEKALSIGTTGVKQDYDIIEQIVAVGTLASQNWSTGQATYTGKQGQWTVDANYKYDCIATNTWIRTPINEARYDMWLADINDSAADKTSSDLDTAYATAQIGQWVCGTVRNIYYKHGTNDWIRIPRNITTDNTYIPERLADIAGVTHGYALTLKAGYDIKSIRAVAETTTAGNISLGSTGTAEVSSLQITAGCSSNGNVTVTLNGTAFNVAVTTAANNAILVANVLRAATYTGYVVGGTPGTDTLTFTSTKYRAETDSTYSEGSTGATGSMSTSTQGVDPNTDIISATTLSTTIGDGVRLVYGVNPLFPTASNRVLYIGISSVATVKLQIVLERIY